MKTISDADRIRDPVALGNRVRARIKILIDELDALPEEPGPVGLALITWRVCLLVLIWDVSEAPLTLGLANTGQIRAIRMLNRPLFEYGIRLEYYAYATRDAVKDWMNAEAWLKTAVRVIDDKDMVTWARAERHYYYQMLKVEGDFEYPSVSSMIARVFRG